MDSGVRDLATRSIEERWRGLSDAISNLDIAPTAPTAAHHLARFVRAAVEFGSREMIGFARSDEPAEMTDDEFTQAATVAASTYRLLIKILHLLVTQTAGPVPLELSESLGRVLRKLYPSSDLLLISNPFANYAVTDVSGELIKPLTEKIKGFQPPPLPDRIFVISLPSTETDHALIHCIVAHEFSHAFWTPDELGETLNLRDTAPPFIGAANETVIADAVQAARAWAQELASDMFALHIFGPAYVCATIHFSAAVTSINLATPSHPPVRSRLLWLFRAMDELYKKPDGKGYAYGANTAKFLDVWRSEATDTQWQGVVQPPDWNTQVASLALNAIYQHGLFEKVLKIGQELAATRFTDLYTVLQYETDLRLVDYINAHVPPVVWLTEADEARAVTAAGIMNAAWECYHGGLKEFGSRLDDEIRADRLAVNRVYNEFLLKTLELNEIARQWSEFQERH